MSRSPGPLYEARVNAGICVVCGKKLARTNRLACVHCAKRRADKRFAWREPVRRCGQCRRVGHNVQNCTRVDPGLFPCRQCSCRFDGLRSRCTTCLAIERDRHRRRRARQKASRELFVKTIEAIGESK